MKATLTKKTNKRDGSVAELPLAPTDHNLEAMLGVAFPVLNEALTALAAVYPELEHEWKFSPRSGWYQIWLLEGRRLFYVLPKPGSFRLNLILGDKAIKTLKAGPQAAELKRRLESAKRWPEGTMFSFEAADFDPQLVVAMIEAKLET